MSTFTERLIAAHQAGLAERRADQDRAKEDALRKLQMDHLQLQLKTLKLEQNRKDAELEHGIQASASGGPSGQATVQTPTFQPPASAPDSITPQGVGGAPENLQQMLIRLRQKPVAALPMPIHGLSQSVETGAPPAFPDIPVPMADGRTVMIPGTNYELEQQKATALRQQSMREKQQEELFKAALTAHTTPEGGTTTFGIEGVTPTVTINGQPKPAPPPTEGTIGRGLAAAYFKQKHGITRPLTDVEQAQADAEYDAYKASVKPKDPSVAASRTDARLDRSYQYNDSALNKAAEPITTALARFGRLADTINQATPQADALIAPELMTVMAGGQGSGLRINEAEISRVLGGRSNFESLKAALNKWQTDPTKALSVTPAQRQQIRALMDDVGGKLLAKQQIIEDSRQDLINADTVEEHRKIVASVKQKLNKIDQGMPSAPTPTAKPQKITMPNGQILTLGNDGKYHAAK